MQNIPSSLNNSTRKNSGKNEHVKSIPVLHSGAIFRTNIIQVALEPNLLLENNKEDLNGM